MRLLIGLSLYALDRDTWQVFSASVSLRPGCSYYHLDQTGWSRYVCFKPLDTLKHNLLTVTVNYKLWTIRTNECESTIDAHHDKIWALDLSPCGTALFSGGADSKIAVWRDSTKENDDAAREAEEKNILMEQKLSNHLRNKQYEDALEIALKLDKPNQVLRVRGVVNDFVY